MNSNKISVITRRHFISTSVSGMAAISLRCAIADKKKFLIRYDTESRQREEMKGFFEKIVNVFH